MRLKEKLRMIESKLREMYIDGAKELALSTQSNSGRFANLYSELIHTHKEMKRMVDGDAKKDCDRFDNMAMNCLILWGKVYSSLANEKIKEYKDISDVPKNIFRSASPQTVSKLVKLGSNDVKVVPFKSRSLDNEFIYTLDEVDWLKSKNLSNDAIDAITIIKKEFHGSYIETDFDLMMGNTQSKGAIDNERDRFYRATNKFSESQFSKELRLPLEEQQRYSRGAS